MIWGIAGGGGEIWGDMGENKTYFPYKTLVYLFKVEK